MASNQALEKGAQGSIELVWMFEVRVVRGVGNDDFVSIVDLVEQLSSEASMIICIVFTADR